MKKLFFLFSLLLSIPAFSQGAGFYTIYDPVSQDVLYRAYFTEKPQNATNVDCTVSYIRAKFNAATQTYFEGATEQEIENAYKASLEPYYNRGWIVNSEVTEEQTSITLDEIYPDAPEQFRVYCTNVGTGMGYIKADDSWLVMPMAKI